MKKIKQLALVRQLISKLSMNTIEETCCIPNPGPRILSVKEMADTACADGNQLVRINWLDIPDPSAHKPDQVAIILATLPAGYRIDINNSSLQLSYCKLETGDWILENGMDRAVAKILYANYLRDGYVITEKTPELVRQRMPTWMPKSSFATLYAQTLKMMCIQGDDETATN